MEQGNYGENFDRGYEEQATAGDRDRGTGSG